MEDEHLEVSTCTIQASWDSLPSVDDVEYSSRHRGSILGMKVRVSLEKLQSGMIQEQLSDEGLQIVLRYRNESVIHVKLVIPERMYVYSQ